MNDVVIEMNELKKSFGSKSVLDGITLSVKRGEIIGYIGPNGAGKSTTVKLMLGMIDGYEGSLKVFGEEIRETDDEYKRRIGYVPENAELYDTLTAKEYLVFVGGLYGIKEDVAERRAEALMTQFDLAGVYDQRISSFSKGMRQKVLITSSLLHNPDVLFYDEPLSGLDANSMQVVREMLAYLAREGKTIFYSSHVMDVVEKISNRIVLINGGVIVADGTFEELKQQNQKGSLQDIFNQLTGFNRHDEIAASLVRVITGDAND